jgi:hypothetical protein
MINLRQKLAREGERFVEKKKRFSVEHMTAFMKQAHLGTTIIELGRQATFGCPDCLLI